MRDLVNVTVEKVSASKRGCGESDDTNKMDGEIASNGLYDG